MIEHDQTLIHQAKEYARLRRRAAAELHAMCLQLVEGINAHLDKPRVELTPAAFSGEDYRDDGANVFQINVSGRIVHLEFHATVTPSCTEKLSTAYILEGAVRAFNQDFLEMSLVPEQPLFCCPKERELLWVWFDTRLQRTSRLDQARLITLLERLTAP